MNSTEGIALDATNRIADLDTAKNLNRVNGQPLGLAPAKRKSIAVLTPTLGAISMWWATALTDLVWPMNMMKGIMPLCDLKGDEVGEMRNRLVKLALDSEKQHDFELEALMWIDDDVIFNKFVMLQLASHDADIASGVYFAKGEAGNNPLIFPGPSSGTSSFVAKAQDDPHPTIEAWGWAQGLCLIKMSVYRRMMDELDLGKDKYGNTCFYKKPEFGVDPAGYMTLGGTEDFYFFDNACKLGYRPLVDCTKFAFGYHYDLKLKTAYPKVQWEQYLRCHPVVWPMKDGSEVVWQ